MAMSAKAGRLRNPVALWLCFNVMAICVWLLLARLLWPWPNYGYCDIPVFSWVYFFDISRILVLLVELVVLLVVTIRAVPRRDFARPVSVLATVAMWYALARFDFNPNAIPGDGCWS